MLIEIQIVMTVSLFANSKSKWLQLLVSMLC